MALDPAAVALLKELLPPGAPRGWQLPLDVRRAGMLARVRRYGPEPAALHAVTDLRLTGVPVRLYQPNDTGATPQPALIYFHGGGWALGSIETHDAICSQIARRSGWLVLAVEYRLAPEHRFPVPVFDCWSVVSAAYSLADALHIDRTRIAVGGDSAGGNLAAVMTLLARDYDFPLAGQVLIYPITDYLSARPSYEFDYLLGRADMESFWNYYLHHEAEAASPLASPIRAASLANLPPALVLTAEFDPLRDEAEDYASLLTRAGVPVAMTRYQGMVHGFIPLARALPQGYKAIEEIAQYLQSLPATD
jgi:acetyl esterase